MSKLIMKDQERTVWPRTADERSLDTLPWVDDYKNESIIVRLAIAIVLTLAIATVYAVCSEPVGASVTASSVTSATLDNLMSEERSEYMVLFEHGEQFEEGDMQ